MSSVRQLRGYLQTLWRFTINTAVEKSIWMEKSIRFPFFKKLSDTGQKSYIIGTVCRWKIDSCQSSVKQESHFFLTGCDSRKEKALLKKVMHHILNFIAAFNRFWIVLICKHLKWYLVPHRVIWNYYKRILFSRVL